MHGSEQSAIFKYVVMSHDVDMSTRG